MSAPPLYKDLEERFGEVLELNRLTEGDILLGDLAEFDPKSVKESALKFVVRGQKLWITHSNSYVHAFACTSLVMCLRDEVRKACNPEFSGQLSASADCDFRQVPSVYGCTAKEGKKFDAFVATSNMRSLKHPAIVSEISFRHERFPLLLEEGLASVSRFTDVGWNILVDLIESTREGEVLRINDIRVVVLERLTAYASDSRLLGAATKRDCRQPIPLSTTMIEPNMLLDSKVIYDNLFSKEDILSPDFNCLIEFETALFASYVGSHAWFPGGSFNLSLTNFLVEVIETTDILVLRGTYPFY